MLSSSVVTVLAPQWSGRIKLNKRFEGTGTSEPQKNLRDLTSTTTNNTHDCFQETADMSLTDRSQAPSRVPFLGVRSNTVAWSTNSGPASLDCESKRKITQTVSLDANSGNMDKRKIDASALSPVGTRAYPVFPPSLHPKREEQRNPQTGPQGGLSSLSSKPTTSSLLMSLRRFNSNGRRCNMSSTFSQTSLSSLNSSSADEDERLFTTHRSNTFNDNDKERSKPPVSPLSISYRKSEVAPVVSPSSCNYRERTAFEKHLFSGSSTNNEGENAHFTKQPQLTNRTQSSLSCSKQTFLSRRPSESQQSCRGSDKSTHLQSKGSVSSLRHSTYDQSALLKSRPILRTSLTSTCLSKQVSQEVCSPLPLNDPMKMQDKPNTTIVSLCNDSSGLAPLTDNQRLSHQMPNNGDNGTAELVHQNKQRNADDSPDHKSERLVKQQFGSNLNREPQKPLSLSDVLSGSKSRRATAQTIQSHHKELLKHDFSNSSLTTRPEYLPTLLYPKCSDTPTERRKNYNDNHSGSKTNSTPISPQKNTQRFTEPLLSPVSTNTLNNQALSFKTTSGLPLDPDTKSSSYHAHPFATQSNIHVSSNIGSSSQTPKFKNTATTTPIGFERHHVSVPRPFHPKTMSSLISTVNTSSKTNCSPACTASTTLSSTISSYATATATACPSHPIRPVTSAIASSPITISSLLTPPATPITTSPNYSDNFNSDKGRTFSEERDPKKLLSEGKRLRRITWEDSVDLQPSEPTTVKEPEPSLVPSNAPSPSRSLRSIKAPSIFSFLRSGGPAMNTPSLCSPVHKISNIEVVKGGKYRSLSSDSADLAFKEREKCKETPCDTMTFDQATQDLTTRRQERTSSVELGRVQCHSSAPLSLPPDFSSSYKLRYSSPPYSTLMSTRSAKGETKTTPISPLFQQPSQSNHTHHLSIHTDPVAASTLPTSKPSLSAISLPQSLSLPFQSRTVIREMSRCGVSETDQVNNNHSKNNCEDHKNGRVLLVKNRVHVSSHSLQDYRTHNSPSTCVTETLVYSVKPKVGNTTVALKNTTPKPLQQTAKILVSVEAKSSQQSHTLQSKEAAVPDQCNPSHQSFNVSSTESQLPNDESFNGRTKENVLGKSRFISVENNDEQNPKRSRFSFKKSASTPVSNLSRSESDTANKSGTKMDQVLHRLRQTFSSRRCDDDMSFPWKWRRPSHTPSLSGSSDISNVSDTTVESAKTLEKGEQEKGDVLKDSEKGTESTDGWEQDRYTPISPSAFGSTLAGDHFSVWPVKSTPETDHDEQNASAKHTSESKTQLHLTIHSPTTHQFDFYKDNRTDSEPINQFLSCRDHSPGRSPNPSAAYPAQFRRSTPSPRSPFSPFSSLSPLSPFPSPDVTDDSVFYSPKLQRRRESSSPCEAGEGITLGGARRSRASTGPPSAGPGQDRECLTSTYADLKYGIEPGRSFSVSSVLSSRPSGPGRISIGSRFMSVGDLSESSLTCRGTGKDSDQWSLTPDWTTKYDCQPNKDCRMLSSPNDSVQMRSRSLPRSLTRRLANWSSGECTSPPANTTASKPAHLWSPNMTTCQFAWDTDGPPTPPLTPPLSPVSRRMSQPPTVSSPSFPCSSGSPQHMDSQSSRGHLPSKGYVSSLSTFEESSDSSSDTTTDDEYYLETGEGEEKETEL